MKGECFMKNELFNIGRTLCIGKDVPMNEAIRMIEQSYKDILTFPDTSYKQTMFIDLLKARIKVYREFKPYRERIENKSGFYNQRKNKGKLHVNWVEVSYK